MNMKRNPMLYKLIFYTFVIASGAPVAVLAVYSVSASWPYPKLLPETLTLKHLLYVFVANKQTFGALFNSAFIALLVTFITLVIAVPAAKALGLYRFKGKELFKILVLLPLMVPTLTITMGIHISMIKLGLTGTLIGIVIIHTIFTLPYAIRLLTDVFEIIGESYEEQAWMLGAGSLFTFRNVTFPLILPGLLSASVISFIVSFSQYIPTLLIGGGRIITLPMLMVPHIQSGEMQVSAVYSILFIVSALISLAVIEKMLKRYYRDVKVFYL